VIVSIGKFAGSPTRKIDAKGHVLALGFIDTHTHHDPQICRDRIATPSIEHGVTIVPGNRSLKIAPVRKDRRRKLIKMFEKVEDTKEPTFAAAASVWAANVWGKGSYEG
jgi:N-acyl-D-amino-acid deacylase